MAAASPAPQLRLRGTFIDLDDAPEGGARRARSLPPLRAAREAFAEDAAYVATLSERLGAMWAVPRPAAAQRAEAPAEAPSGGASGGSGVSTEAPAEAAANQGSYGHPELCSRPCLYFASGQCANGSGCAFCHHQHAKRPSHLEKRQREALEAMPKGRAKALIFQVVRQKVIAFDGSVDTALACDDLAWVCGQDGAQLAGKLPRLEHGIVQALKSASLRVSMVALQRIALADDPTGQAVAEAFLQRAPPRNETRSHRAARRQGFGSG